MKNTFRRKFDKMLSEGQGRQLLWLLAIVLCVLIILLILANLLGGNDHSWKEIVGLFLDPGNFYDRSGKQDVFRLIVTLLGVFLFSSILISVYTNVFENVASAYKKGENRYEFSDHILIIGARYCLKEMLWAIKENGLYEEKDIVVMTTKDVSSLRTDMEIFLSDRSFCGRITYYHSNRKLLKHLQDACAGNASLIYVLGEDEEEAHDALNIRCVQHLQQICVGKGKIIPCYVLLEEHSTMEVFQYLHQQKGINSKTSRLNVEIINQYEYEAGKLLVNTDFLPAFTAGDKGKRLRIIIAGIGNVAEAFSIVSEHVCHYPNFHQDNRTVITFVDEDMRVKMNEYIAAYQNIFDLSHYRFHSAEGEEVNVPKEEYGDFLDIEWEFVDGDLRSPFVRSLLTQWVKDENQEMVIAICNEDDSENVKLALHLPKIIYDKAVKIAVYQKCYDEIINNAADTGMYGQMFCFGDALLVGDALFQMGSLMGKRVNRVYDLEYGNPPAEDMEIAWKNISFAHKLSSIASANSIPMKLRCFGLEATQKSVSRLSDSELEMLSELEHRRWMSSVMLLGYYAATKIERKDRSQFKQLKNERFIHLDIAPYEELLHEAEKDKLIVQNIPFILTGARE